MILTDFPWKKLDWAWRCGVEIRVPMDTIKKARIVAPPAKFLTMASDALVTAAAAGVQDMQKPGLPFSRNDALCAKFAKYELS